MFVQGKVAIVTGGAKGIGRYVAHTFLHAGSKVAVVDSDEVLLHRTVRELLFLSTDVMGIKADVKRESEVSEMVERVSTRFDRIDVLVNNAGIVPYFPGNEMDSLDHASIANLGDPIMQSRLGGTYICTKYVLPIMKQQRSGHIINVYGTLADNGTDGYAASTSRKALQCFTRYVAHQVRDSNVCVVVMVPASRPIATDYVSTEDQSGLPGVEMIAGRFVLASGAGMDLSGRLVTCDDGYLDAAY
jgi:NAD(P)-dependent dehydrogenase (short-subunit alcohol dehydrogenase family)